MKKRDNVKKIDFSDDFLIESAEKHFQDGDYFAALKLLNRQAEHGKPNADAFAAYADVYEALELYAEAVDSWYRFLDTCNEADFGEGYEGLSVCYMHLGDDFQSNFYFRRMLEADGEEEIPFDPALEKRAQLHVLPSGEEEHRAHLNEGEEEMRGGDLEQAKQKFSSIPKGSAHYADAVGYLAMCELIEGNEERAEEICAEHLKDYSDNVQTLVTYCAALGARKKKEEAKEVAHKLYDLKVESEIDRYRVATALCETEQHEEAYLMLKELAAGEYYYDDTILWFLAVAAHNTGRDEEAIEALERREILYPRGAVAKYYLSCLRRAKESGETVEMGYTYLLPMTEYSRIANEFLGVLASEEKRRDPSALHEEFLLAADVLEGRDEKLLALAIRAAIRLRADWFVRSVLINYRCHPLVKFTALKELAVRNEENNFGVVLLGLYYEYSTVKIEIGTRARKEFLAAFGEVYSRFAVLGGEWNGGKLAVAAEDVYATLDETGLLSFAKERDALAAVIYREARLKGGVRGLKKICALFGAEEATAKEILKYLV